MITALNWFIVWQNWQDAHILIITGTEWVCCLAELAGCIHSDNSTELLCCLAELAGCICSDNSTELICCLAELAKCIHSDNNWYLMGLLFGRTGGIYTFS